MPRVDASKPKQNPCNGISNWSADSHITQREDKLLVCSSYKQPAVINTQLPEKFKEKYWWLSKYHGWNKSFAMAEQTLANQGMLHSTPFPQCFCTRWPTVAQEMGATLAILNIKTADSSQQFKIPCARLRDLLEREAISSVKSSSKCLAVSRTVATIPS